jgi:hypothetical protein
VFHTVYRTTNLVNGKFYIGVHKTDDPNDGYLGSGKLIGRAFQKYGFGHIKVGPKVEKFPGSQMFEFIAC